MLGNLLPPTSESDNGPGVPEGDPLGRKRDVHTGNNPSPHTSDYKKKIYQGYPKGMKPFAAISATDNRNRAFPMRGRPHLPQDTTPEEGRSVRNDKMRNILISHFFAFSHNHITLPLKGASREKVRDEGKQQHAIAKPQPEVMYNVENNAHCPTQNHPGQRDKPRGSATRREGVTQG